MNATINFKEKEPQVQLPQLIKKSDTYKLFVPRKVEEKIRYLIRKFPSTEWSGVLFYTHTGTFENNDLEIHCEDIYPMDLGTTGWTEFKMTEEVTAYMAENIELFDCELGLIHSHHSMGAFFSGQDSKMLQQEGNDMNCFVSLVVDTRGTYVAAITRKIQTKSEITVKVLGTSYEFFGDGPVCSNTIAAPQDKTQTVDKEFIEYFMLDVQREVVDNPLAFLDARFDEIQEKKKQAEKKPMTTNSLLDDFDFNQYKPKHSSSYLFDYDTMESLKTSSKEEPFPEEDLDNYSPDDNLIKTSVWKMLLLSLNCNAEGLDMKQWIKRHMKNVYDKIFTDVDAVYTSFEAWCDFIVEFMVEHFVDSSAPEIFDQDYYHAIIAESMSAVLRPYSEENDYIQAYIDRLELYINY